MFSPRPVQRECLDALSVARGTGASRALIVMATGLGKTAVAAFDLRHLLAEKPGRILYLCHNNYIIEHARETIEVVLGPGVTHGYFHGEEAKEFRDVDCLYASLQSMATWREAFLRDEFRYIVIDESHHVPARTYQPTIDYFEPDFMLAMTATPDRADLKDIRRVFGQEVFSVPLETAIGRGLLTPVDYRVEVDSVSDMRHLPTPDGRASIKQLNRSIFIPRRDEEIIRIIEERAAEFDQPRMIVFCPTVSYCDRLGGLMSDALTLHSHQSKKAQHARLKVFQEGRVNRLITVNKLNEGVDVPEANVVVFLRATSSRTLFIQQLGRGLRQLPGKDRVLVLDFAANCERLEMLQDLWREVESVASRSGPADGVSPISIDVGSINFTEYAKEILALIRLIRAGHTKEQLLSDLQLVARRLGRPPKSHELYGFYKSGEIHADYEPYLREFGGWDKALIAAGLLARDDPKLQLADERRQLVNRFKTLAVKLGRTPTTYDTQRAYREALLPDLATIRRLYTYHHRLIKAAGLPPTPFSNAQELMLGRLHAEQDRIGRALVPDDIMMMRHPTAEECIGLFGSIRQAIAALAQRLAG